jgi:hypothetical protein
MCARTRYSRRVVGVVVVASGSTIVNERLLTQKKRVLCKRSHGVLAKHQGYEVERATNDESICV